MEETQFYPPTPWLETRRGMLTTAHKSTGLRDALGSWQRFWDMNSSRGNLELACRGTISSGVRSELQGLYWAALCDTLSAAENTWAPSLAALPSCERAVLRGLKASLRLLRVSNAPLTAETIEALRGAVEQAGQEERETGQEASPSLLHRLGLIPGPFLTLGGWALRPYR